MSQLLEAIDRCKCEFLSTVPIAGTVAVWCGKYELSCGTMSVSLNCPVGL